MPCFTVQDEHTIAIGGSRWKDAHSSNIFHVVGLCRMVCQRHLGGAGRGGVWEKEMVVTKSNGKGLYNASCGLGVVSLCSGRGVVDGQLQIVSGPWVQVPGVVCPQIRRSPQGFDNLTTSN